MSTSIEWTDETWNPVVGCTPVSPGCLNCYAARMARRQEAMGTPGYEARVEPERKTMPDAFGTRTIPAKTIRIAEVVNGRAVFTGEVRTLPDRLTVPLHWRTPRLVFVNSMSDLFHESVPFEFIDQVFAVMALCPQHTFQILTKRPERMAEYTGDYKVAARLWDVLVDHNSEWGAALGRTADTRNIDYQAVVWPLPNVWLGTSVEDQTRADERIPWLLKCPAAVRFLSCEPLLGEIDLDMHNPDGWGGSRRHFEIDWVIVGGESGANARACNVEWIRSIVTQCKGAGVPVFVKQLGAKPEQLVDRPHVWKTWPLGLDTRGREGGSVGSWGVWLKDRKGGDMAEWPDDLRVREMPEKGKI